MLYNWKLYDAWQKFLRQAVVLDNNVNINNVNDNNVNIKY